MQNILVSIITPNYNSEAFIDNTIKSVIAQTYSNWELIIVDDCSTDKSYNIALNYSKIDKRIKVYRNSLNKGAAYCRNFAIGKSNGDYVAFLDSDDIWYENKLQLQLEFMIKNNYLFTYTKYNLIDEYSNFIGKEVSGPSKVTQKMLFKSNYLGCLTVMYNQKYLGKYSIDNSIMKRNDHALWLKIIKNAKNCYLLPIVLSSYRRREGSISKVSIFKMLKYHYYLYKKSEGMSVFKSLLYVFYNLFYGFIRKNKYILK